MSSGANGGPVCCEGWSCFRPFLVSLLLLGLRGVMCTVLVYFGDAGLTQLFLVPMGALCAVMGGLASGH